MTKEQAIQLVKNHALNKLQFIMSYRFNKKQEIDEGDLNELKLMAIQSELDHLKREIKRIKKKFKDRPVLEDNKEFKRGWDAAIDAIEAMEYKFKT